MYVPPKKIKKKSDGQLLISSTIDKIRSSLEVDKYEEERKKINKD